jgi:hypothetical protein
MTKPQLKREMKNRISKLASNLYNEVAEWDRAELETAIEVINGFTQTNCGWTAYQLSPGLSALFSSRLHDITPSSQEIKQ